MQTTIPAGLRLASDSLDDLEALREATKNRYGFATRDTADKDGRFRGLGLTDEHPMVAVTGALADELLKLEKSMVNELKKEFKKTPYSAWQKLPENVGIGEKQLPRLLAAIGDPYLNEVTGEPRTLRQLWAYAGLAVDNGVARRPWKGMTQEEMFTLGNPTSKKRAWLIAERCSLQKGKEISKFRGIYDAEREHYADAVHDVECKRCGPKGKPAQPGSPLSNGHQYARALRKVSKEILRDLWLVAREYHTGETQP